jgi:hypothetical protein
VVIIAEIVVVFFSRKDQNMLNEKRTWQYCLDLTFHSRVHWFSLFWVAANFKSTLS